MEEQFTELSAEGMLSRLTDEVPCIVRIGNTDVEAFLHPMLSTSQLAKVTLEDGSYKDMLWYKVREVGVGTRLDMVDWGVE